MSYAIVAAGLVLLVVGGEFLVRGSVSLAGRLGVSPLLIGLIVVGFGTSAPELGVSIDAALNNAPGIVMGNVIGSSIANILLVFAFALMIAPMTSWPKTAINDALVMVAASLTLLGATYLGVIDLKMGLGFIAAIIIYLTATYWMEKSSKLQKASTPDTLHEQEAHEFEDIPFTTTVAVLVSIGSIGVLVGGAHLLVTGAITIARDFGISESIIGLTLVAIGTSLPELATAIVAAARRHHDVILGNIIGSNIFNIFCVLGVTASITDITIEDRFRLIDGPILVGTCLTLLVILWRFKSIGRPVGLAFMLSYGAYMYFLYSGT
ncbi:MAG: calcium/sodium antiporter [Rhodospirillales bacterium]|jgi:cation:H+ antiporter